MTLIVGLANRHQAILVSDRRLTRNGAVYDDESNKAAVFVCRNARFAVGFTGLAELGDGPPWKGGPPPRDRFVTRWWLLNALEGSASPDYLALPTIERFCDRATKDISALRTRSANDKALSVMFTGFVYEPQPRVCGCVVSNFEWNPGVSSTAFTLTGWREKVPGGGKFAGIFLAGMTAGVEETQKRALMELLEEDAPAPTLVGKALQLIRHAARSPASRGLVGAQCTSIVLSADAAHQPSMQYHTATVAHAIHGTSFVVARSPDESAVFAEPETLVSESLGGPRLPVGPKIGRNKPCWCGSQKKYKKCHGA